MQGRLCSRQELMPRKRWEEVGEDGEPNAGSQGPVWERRFCGGYERAPNGINAQVRQKRLTLAAKSARFIGSRK